MSAIKNKILCPSESFARCIMFHHGVEGEQLSYEPCKTGFIKKMLTEFLRETFKILQRFNAVLAE